MAKSTTFQTQVQQGERFKFGENWKRFLSTVDEDRIVEAEKSLQEALKIDTLQDLTFVDVGCGSGLFSLAACRLGAAKVHSFDYDPSSAECARYLKRHYFPKSDHWTIEEGSVLDKAYLNSLDKFDIVYSWGVLHHTGSMWQALENITHLVKDRGKLYVSLYNDQGKQSIRWRKVKRFYCSSWLGKWLVIACFFPIFAWQGLAADLAQKRNPLARYRDYKRQRGMSIFHDWIDWLGGYPFEVSRVDETVAFYQNHDFVLNDVFDCGQGSGCNRFLFTKVSPSEKP
ncbi:methyltransferase domain-containing protein [bacterium]|nr:methyltransferase domain-containing protein [bacterium]